MCHHQYALLLQQSPCSNSKCSNTCGKNPLIKHTEATALPYENTLLQYPRAVTIHPLFSSD